MSEVAYDFEERHITGVTTGNALYIDCEREPKLILVYSFDHVSVSGSSATDLTPRMAVAFRKGSTALTYSRDGKYTTSGLSNNPNSASGLSEYDNSSSHGSFYFFEIEIKTDADPWYYRATLYLPWSNFSYDLDVILAYEKE